VDTARIFAEHLAWGERLARALAFANGGLTPPLANRGLTPPARQWDGACASGMCRPISASTP
jgi:hypothetical protein